MSRLSRRFALLCALTAAVGCLGCRPDSAALSGQATGNRSASNTTTHTTIAPAAALDHQSIRNDVIPSATDGATDRATSNAASTPDTPNRARSTSKPPKLELVEAAGDTPLRVVLRGLDAGSLHVCRKLTASELSGALAVYVDNRKGRSGNDDGAEADLPQLLGDCRVDGDTLVFEPRYAPRPGIHLRAEWDPAKIPCGGPGKVQVVFERHAPPVVPTARVTAIYPTRDVLPENQLKFYLHFSQPMSRGEAYSKVRLLDDKGQAVDRPFLELGEELWDRSGTRFTLYFDPGRIKRGLQPRELFGPSLIEGGRYKLVIDALWQDAEGAPLVESFTKSFSVAAPDETQPDPKRWKLRAPAAATREPLTVELGESLDRALLERVLIVQTDAAVAVDGDVTVDAGETRWQFTPTQPWNAGGYRLVVETILEDLAGNSIGRPFEVNMLAEQQPAAAPDTIALPFEVAEPKSATP